MEKIVYILDNDAKTAELIKYALDTKHYTVMCFDDITNFVDSYKITLPDIVISELQLPDGNALNAVNKLKSLQPDLWHIVLSSNTNEVDIVRALDNGADDYITKPFSILQLVARINAVFRRNIRHSIIQNGEYLIDTDAMTIHYHGQKLPLTNKEYRLLRMLVENRGKVLSREKILNSVWGYDKGETRTLDNHIAHLRKLGINLETIFGVGYKLVK